MSWRTPGCALDKLVLSREHLHFYLALYLELYTLILCCIFLWCTVNSLCSMHIDKYDNEYNMYESRHCPMENAMG